MKPVLFSKHSLDLMPDRGTDRAEVELAIRAGELTYIKGKRVICRKNMPFNKEWKGKKYAVKQVMPVINEESDRITVVTVFVSFVGGCQ